MSEESEQASLDEIVGEYAEEEDAEEDTEDGFAYHMEQTAFGELPDGWDFAKSEEMLEYIRSGISDSQNGDNEGIPVTRIETISDGVVNYEKVGYVEVDDETDYSDDKLQRGDLLFSNINSREEIGKTAIYKGEEELYHGMNLLRIRYDTEVANPWYTYFVYDSPMSQDVFFRMSKAAVGQSSINQSQMGNYHIPLPPLPEQRKIASVLYNVDEAIRKTEEIIEATKRVKKGVMQEVFREGIKGRETKETWLGEVPDDWEIVQFSELISETRNGIYKKEDEYGGDYPILKMGDMFGDIVLKADPDEMEKVELSDKEVEKYEIQQGDLLFARRSLNVEGAGECTLIPELSQTTVFESSMIRVRLEETAFPNFYAQYFESPVGSKSIERIVTTTTASGIAGEDLRNLRIPLPELEEQQQIADALEVFDGRINSLIQEKSQLHRLKRALMQDLLTGEVRTKDRDIEVLPEVEAHG